MPRKRSRSCKSGQILRKSYSRRSRSGSGRVRVKSTCIKDLGRPGHGPKLWSVTPGLLGKYGYHAHSSNKSRATSLKKAVRSAGYATTIRRLNAVKNYTSRSQPANSRIYAHDIKYVQDNLSNYSKSKRSRRSSSRRRRKRSRSRSRK